MKIDHLLPPWLRWSSPPTVEYETVEVALPPDDTAPSPEEEVRRARRAAIERLNAAMAEATSELGSPPDGVFAKVILAEQGGFAAAKWAIPNFGDARSTIYLANMASFVSAWGGRSLRRALADVDIGHLDGLTFDEYRHCFYQPLAHQFETRAAAEDFAAELNAELALEHAG